MAEYITVRSGEFRAEISLEHLGELPRTNFRKLLRLMRDNPDENLDDLGRWIRGRPAETKAAWAEASREYQHGWRFAPKRARDENSLRIMRENRRLKTAVKQTKAAYDTAQALKTIFEKEIN